VSLKFELIFALGSKYVLIYSGAVNHPMIIKPLVLSVDIQGNSLVDVTWMKDGKPLDPGIDPRVTITTGITKSTLRLANFDKGRYSVSLKKHNGAVKEPNSNVAIRESI